MRLSRRRFLNRHCSVYLLATALLAVPRLVARPTGPFLLGDAVRDAQEIVKGVFIGRPANPNGSGAGLTAYFRVENVIKGSPLQGQIEIELASDESSGWPGQPEIVLLVNDHGHWRTVNWGASFLPA